MVPSVMQVLLALNQVLTAGLAVLALALWLYTLAFNLRDRVALAFSLTLLALTLAFGGEAIGSAAQAPEVSLAFLRLSLLGVVFVPPTALHFSDALLATTGRPSRGRRRLLVRLFYLLAGGVALAVAWGGLDRGIVFPRPAPHLVGTPAVWGLWAYYTLGSGWALVNMARALRRSVVGVSRRRLLYLFLGALAVLPGTFPWLLLGGAFGVRHPWLFVFSATVLNLALPLALVGWAYAVAFFGVPWPDRVVRARLLRWLLRGPFVAVTTLAVVTFVRRVGAWLGQPYTAAVPITMVSTLLVLEYLIGLGLPHLEALLLAWEDEDQTLRLLRNLEERLFTQSDLTQFVEAVLAAVCDLLQVPQAFLGAVENDAVQVVAAVGGAVTLPQTPFTAEAPERWGALVLYRWNGYRLLPLHDETGQLIGLLGFRIASERASSLADEETVAALHTLAERAVMALEDRRLQRQIGQAVQALERHTETLGRLRAAARFDQRRVLAPLDELPPSAELSQWVKDALNHFWGGPKLTENPLLGLQVVRQAAAEHDGNLVQGLRSVLRQAVESLRPQGERRFTAEWLLYNILDLKFLQGQRARDVAARLAVSEADLYRKQRVALEQVAQVLLEMERRARDTQTRTDSEAHDQEQRPIA